MTQAITRPAGPTLELDELKVRIRKLNSKAGQMKMDLHDIAEGLPTDLDKLPDVAAKTYEIFCLLRELKQQFKTLDQNVKQQMKILDAP